MTNEQKLRFFTLAVYAFSLVVLALDLFAWRPN